MPTSPKVIGNLTVLGYHLVLNTKMKLLTCELGQVNSIMQNRKHYMAAWLHTLLTRAEDPYLALLEYRAISYSMGIAPAQHPTNGKTATNLYSHHSPINAGAKTTWCSSHAEEGRGMQRKMKTAYDWYHHALQLPSRTSCVCTRCQRTWDYPTSCKHSVSPHQRNGTWSQTATQQTWLVFGKESPTTTCRARYRA